MKRHLIIPDAQIKPGSPTDHIKWCGEAILDYKPDVIVFLDADDTGREATVDVANSYVAVLTHRIVRIEFYKI